ncbi:type II secretion system protein [Microbacterium sp. CFBP9034]|uniref:type II secretion system protein n=1 Tax=Microbacterium sp. CFBP9034 TaxID=3096540 RepID=UPI002A69BF25|nr:prepilin-type N-terminal cleavage/methylation domain-containing protein [Microbacterium sp. CFBP9034]MDY0910043.1 prepilin-type N-terminal cleavage/methylation domain-containing protein [Microbacterium sp. CFBP9034]
MSDHKTHEAGFSLIEIVIAVILLGFIAIALIPLLLQGIRLSSEQSTVATATRQLNALVEDARQAPTCDSLLEAVATKTGFTDGRGKPFQTQGVRGACTPGSAVSVSFTATQGASTLASATALVYVPVAP